MDAQYSPFGYVKRIDCVGKLNEVCIVTKRSLIESRFLCHSSNYTGKLLTFRCNRPFRLVFPCSGSGIIAHQDIGDFLCDRLVKRFINTSQISYAIDPIHVFVVRFHFDGSATSNYVLVGFFVVNFVIDFVVDLRCNLFAFL